MGGADGFKSLGVCSCQPVGCDGELYSTLTVDRCGACGGNGTSCQRVSGSYRKALTQLGNTHTNTHPKRFVCCCTVDDTTTLGIIDYTHGKATSLTAQPTKCLKINVDFCCNHACVWYHKIQKKSSCICCCSPCLALLVAVFATGGLSEI